MRRNMAQPRLSRCLRLASLHSKRTLQSSARDSPPSSADLRDISPADFPYHVTVNGFIRSIRKQKERAFASIGDGSTLRSLQAILSPTQAQRLAPGTAVRLRGVWKSSPNADRQAHDLHVEGVEVLGSADPATYPLQKKYHTPEYLRTMPHLRTRTPFNSTLLRLRSESIAQITKFFTDREFTQTHPPIITSSDCEGAGEVFSVETADDSPGPSGRQESFFRSPKYLTVSSQLHLEALAQSVGKVWTLSPTFRAEKSDTARHLSEFYMLEAEVSFVEEMSRIMDLVEDLIRHLATGLYESRVGCELIHGKRSGDKQGDLETRSQELDGRWRGLMAKDWPRITYTEAIEILQKVAGGFKQAPKWGAGLHADHERWIGSHLGKGKPVFITHYPRDIKPFYMLPSKAFRTHEETVDCFDLLVPELCEIVGGSMREHRLEPLLEKMRTNGMIGPGPDDLGRLKWYVDLRRWGSVPHGGFGLGFDRLLGYLAGVNNIREIVTFPRWLGRCDC